MLVSFFLPKTEDGSAEDSKSYLCLSEGRKEKSKKDLQPVRKTKVYNNTRIKITALEEEVQCNIENPYRQKIDEKLVEISDFNNSCSLTYSRCEVWLFYLVLILFIIMPLFYYIYWTEVQNIGNEISSQITVGFSHSYYLVKAVQRVFWQFELTQNHQKVQDFIQTYNPSSAITVNDLMQHEDRLLSELLHQFHHSFAMSLNRKYLEQPYSEQFQDFRINTSYSTTNLLDFSYNIKLLSERIRVKWEKYLREGGDFELLGENSGSNPLKFLMKNYKTLSGLKSSFRIMEINQERLENNRKNLYFISGGIYFVFFAIIFATVFLVRKSVRSLHNIFKTYTFLPDQSVEQIIGEVVENSEEINCSLPKDSNRKMQLIKNSSENEILYYKTSLKNGEKDDETVPILK